MKEGEKLILVDEQLDRLTKGKAEVPLLLASTSACPSSNSPEATITTNSPPSSTRRRENSYRDRSG
jgi:hypothetical protein